MVKAVLACLVVCGFVGQAVASEKAAESDPAGVYECTGQNPNGSPYKGIVEIVKHNDTYLVRWTMPDNSQVVGIGILSGALLSVSYFGGTPALVVYTIGENGHLEGKWTAGGAGGKVFIETLTKMPEGAQQPPKPPKPSKRDAPPRPRIPV